MRDVFDYITSPNNMKLCRGLDRIADRDLERKRLRADRFVQTHSIFSVDEGGSAIVFPSHLKD